MDIEAFLLCDAATDHYGKLNVLGAFDAIMAPSVPAVHAQFSIALRIRFKRSESANHPFRISVINEDGKPIVRPFDGNINIQVREGEEFVVSNLIVNMRDVKFQAFGRYSVDLVMDGKPRGSLPLYIKPVPRPSA